MTYQEADAQLGNRAKRKIAHNTYLERRDNAIAVRLHATDILIFTPDGATRYESGKWMTVTTKARMNEFGPALVFAIRGVWYVQPSGTSNLIKYPYKDGMVITADGIVKGAGSDTKALLLRKRVAQYAKGYVTALHAGKVPPPSGGDCWFCALVDSKNGRIKDPSHIHEHFKERYYVPSLLVNALKELGASQSMWWYLGACGWDKTAQDAVASARTRTVLNESVRVEKTLRRFLCRELGLAS